jgi:hypothetical protein
MESEIREKSVLEPLAVPLWPTAGKALNLGKNKSYELAKAGVIPVLPFRPMRVSLAWLRKVTSGETAA